MSVDELRQLYSAEPFQPFVLQMADGRNLLVAKREHIAFGPTGSATVCSSESSFDFVKLSEVAGVFKLPAGTR
jgi:hypothetical protein